MPLYEGISSLGLFNEKHTTVIFDFGSAYTKVGFAGETGPRAILPSLVECPDTNAEVSVFGDKDPDVLRRRLALFVHKLYVRSLLVNPKERRVVVVENLLSATLLKDTIATVLFKHFEVVSVAFVPSHLVSLMTLGISTGLVLDIGYSEASVIPVFEGVPVLNAWQALSLGSQAIQQSLSELLQERGSCIGPSGKEERLQAEDQALLVPQTLEDIVVRCCFVSTPERSERLQRNKQDRSNEPPPPPPEVLYPLTGARTLKIPGTVRELAGEVLFEKDADNLCLPTMMMDAIVQCPIDLRHPLAGNLVIIGGTTRLPGLRKRLLQELRALASSPAYTRHMAPPTFLIHNLPVKENYAAWLGGCILGSSEGGVVPRSVTREQYLAACNSNTPLPDWSSLAHNTLADPRAPA